MYLIIDVESVRDDDLIYDTSKAIERWDGTTPVYETREACLERMERKICVEQGESCFWPLRFQRPVLASFIALDGGLNYLAHKTVFGKSPAKLAAEFWSLIDTAPAAFGTQHLVTFNGKRFDMPLMEIQALKHGISSPWWFREIHAKVWDNPRAYSSANRFHLDMLAELASSGPVGGDLNYWSRLMGLPGKVDTVGSRVDDFYAAEDWDAIHDYCLCDVLNIAGLLMSFLHAHNLNYPSARSSVFEHTLCTIINARKAEGTTSKELDRYWKLYGTEIPF